MIWRIFHFIQIKSEKKNQKISTIDKKTKLIFVFLTFQAVNHKIS